MAAPAPAPVAAAVNIVVVAAGVRLWTMWFADEHVLTKRFEAGGLPAPAFKTTGSVRSALVTDPDGNPILIDQHV